ncbi:MAG: trigger factor [Puniceicoccales bacterium]|nr:trigger factor [Puniceicoccales bacterium]
MTRTGKLATPYVLGNNVKIDIQDVNEVRKIATIRYDAQEIQIEEGLLLRILCKDVKISGFRKGKVPADMVKRQFADELRRRLQQKLTQSAYENLVKEKAWNVFAVTAVDVHEEDGFELIFTIDLRPEIVLEDYKHFPLIPPPTIEVSEEEIEKSIQQLRRQHAEYRKVDRPAQKGDFVRLNYRGILADGREISKLVAQPSAWGEQLNMWEEAGTDETLGIRPIVDALVGLREGDTRKVETDLPPEFEVPELAGQRAIYQIEILEIREQILPEINSDFFLKVKAENLENLKKKLSDELRNHKLQQSRLAQREELIRFLLTNITFTIPESAVIAEQERLLKNFTAQQPQHVIASPGFKDQQKEFFENAVGQARQYAALNFILEYIAKKENIEVTADDMQQLLLQDASALHIAPEKLYKELQQDRQRIQDMQRRVILGKTLHFLLAANTRTPGHSPTETDHSHATETAKS